MIKICTTYLLIVITMYSCNNKKNQLTYNIKDKKIELVLLNNNKFIKYDKITPIKFLIKNIKLSNLRILGPGIDISAKNDSILQGRILVKKKYIKGFSKYIEKDTLHVKIFIINNNVKNKGEILVPLKY